MIADHQACFIFIPKRFDRFMNFIHKIIIFSFVFLIPVNHQIQTFSDLDRVAVLDSDTVVVFGKENGQYKLGLFNLQTGVEMDSVELRHRPWGMAAVVAHGRRRAIAVSDQ